MTNGDLLKIGRVLRVKAELTEGWLSDYGRNFVAKYAAHTGENEQLAYSKLLREVRDSSPIYVSGEICDLLEASVGSWPEKFTLKAEDVPLRQGFVMFENPLWLPMQEWKGEFLYIPLSYIAWFWDTISYGPGEEWHGREALAYSFYQDASAPTTTSIPLGVFHSSGWLFGDDQDWGHIMKRDVTMKPSTAERVKFSTRYLMSLLRFISQEILVSNPVPGREVLKNKNAVRRVKDSLSLTDLPNIHVIHLRKKVQERLSEASGEPKEVHWSHRWVVGSHWHNYFYRSTGEHRPRWVWAYEKGPEGAPLIPKKPAYMVNR
jgi:hypothetical protein